MQRFIKQSEINAPSELVFAWHESTDAFEKLIPPWEKVRIIERSGPGIQRGTRITLEMAVGPFKKKWVAVHTAYEAGRMFQDEQISGPFSSWVHTHIVEARGPNLCMLTDEIRFKLPLGFLGQFVAGSMVRRKLEKLLDYRHRITQESCERDASRLSIAVGGK